MQGGEMKENNETKHDFSEYTKRAILKYIVAAIVSVIGLIVCKAFDGLC